MEKVKKTERQTKSVYREDHVIMNYKRLVSARHWIDPSTGELIRLTHNLKAVYHHRLEQYRSFNKKGLPYHESHQTIADKLALDVDTVKKVIHPLLVRMGLVSIETFNTRKHIVTVYDLKWVKGELVNDRLGKHFKKKVDQYKDKEPLTYEQLKTIRVNQEKVKKVQKNLKEEIVILSKEEFNRLMARGKE